MKRRFAPVLCATLGLATSFVAASRPAAAAPKPPALLGVKFTPPHVKAGRTTKLRIALTRPAPAGGITIAMTDDNPKVLPMPKSIKIPAGARGIGVTITTGSVKTRTDIALTGSYAGITRRDKVTVDP